MTTAAEKTALLESIAAIRAQHLAEVDSLDAHAAQINALEVDDGTVPPLPKPTISAMTVTPSSLPAGGGPVVVDAVVTDATSTTLDGQAVTLPATSTVLASTTLVLIASNASGSVSAQAPVEVADTPPPIPVPTITNLTATPASLPEGGGDVVIAATVTDATTLTLDGSAVALPATVAQTETHQYVLVASNTSGQDSKVVSVPVALPALPTIANMTATPANLPVGGGDVVIDATVTGADSMELDGQPITSLPVTVKVTA